VTPARIVTALLTGLVSTGVFWAGLDIWIDAGGGSPPLTWVAVFVVLALVLAEIAAGLPVRRWMRGKRDRALDPLVAARTAVLAKAAAYGGPLIVGWYLSQALLLLPDLVGARQHRFIIAMIAAVLAVGLSVAGFVVQRWCRVPPEDDTGGTEDPDRDSVR
jgi:hypothetical protein